MLAPLMALPPSPAAGRVRLRTLVLIRWLAVVGQVSAVAIADGRYGLSVPLGACLFVIGAAVLVNLVASAVYPPTRRLSEAETFLILLFDLTQLCFLLYITGGLTNPFALLLLGPVVISAAALQLRATVFLALVAVCYATLLAFAFQPLRFDDGRILAVPPLFAFGFWLSILIGIMFIGFYAHRIATEIGSMSQALLATQMALAREQKLTELGGVVAATAHELGTPLATIKLVSAEMMSMLDDRPDLLADARLIRDQADRCRDILRSMGRAGKDDALVRRAPFGAVVQEAAEPHLARGRRVEIDIGPEGDGLSVQPIVLRRPEIVHALRNVIQNAVDFASDTVRVQVRWTGERLAVTIADDGEGFPAHLIDRIGDPFLRDRRDAGGEGHGGMGLGLFIAKTLLERTGAELVFANAGDGTGGAVVKASWPRPALEVTGPDPVENPQHLAQEASASPFGLTRR
jgi:two-component system sensor histidine kinase RegB